MVIQIIGFALAKGTPRPWTYINSFGRSFPALYALNDKWSLLLVPIIQVAGEHGADFGRSLIYGGGGAAIYNFGKDRSIGIGVGALNNLEQASVFPFILVNWKFNEQFRLATPYRAGPAGLGGIELSYTPIKDLEVALGITYHPFSHYPAHQNFYDHFDHRKMVISWTQ